MKSYLVRDIPGDMECESYSIHSVCDFCAENFKKDLFTDVENAREESACFFCSNLFTREDET